MKETPAERKMTAFDDEETLLLPPKHQHRQQQRQPTRSASSSQSWKVAVSWSMIGAVAALLISAYAPSPSILMTKLQSSAVPMLGGWRQKRSHRRHKSHSYRAPRPSQQDWCMQSGYYDFYGTYRSHHDHAKGGIHYAPGRLMQGTILTAQTDETVYFHMVNVTFGGPSSPYHTPTSNQEKDMFDVYCTMHSDENKKSFCYAPKFFPLHTGFNTHTRCGVLDLPSMYGSALCRQMAMAELSQVGTVRVGMDPDDLVAEQWTARLSTDGTPSNDYDGQLQLFMMNATSDGKWKVPFTHWLTSDDQRLEASFQIMNRKEWDPLTADLPEVPDGCDKAVNVMNIPRTMIPSPVAMKSMVGCPFGAAHQHMMLPSFHHYQK